MAAPHITRGSGLVRQAHGAFIPQLAQRYQHCQFSCSLKREFPRQRPSARPIPSSSTPLGPAAAETPAPKAKPAQPPKPPGPAPTQPPDTYTTIRYTNSQLTTQVSKQTQARLTTAATFFETRPHFLYSASSLRNHPFNEHIPEVIILGASNVGKSSFINALVGKPEIARVSAKPGRTTVMNAFGVGPPPHVAKKLISKGTRAPKESLILMDTPGYGFKSQSSWGETIVKYLGARKMLRGAVVLLSSEKKLLPDDRWLLEQLADANTRTAVVLTKADKGKKDWVTNCTQRAEAITKELRMIGRWNKGGEAWSPEIFVTAAGVVNASRIGNKAGLGGVRAAILEMAGFDIKEDVTKQDEAISYMGNIVSFDDIKWKT